MAQYPNYFPTQQPYNPYGQQYMPNPYMERMANLQQYQQSIQPQQQVIGITGKVVESIDMVNRKVNVGIVMFGRKTVLELDINHVESV